MITGQRWPGAPRVIQLMMRLVSFGDLIRPAKPSTRGWRHTGV